MPDVDLPNSLAWLLAMGALAVAIYNVDRLAHYLRVPSLTKRVLAAAFQPRAPHDAAAPEVTSCPTR